MKHKPSRSTYHVEVVPDNSSQSELWIARVQELPTLKVTGSTRDEAFLNLHEIIRFFDEYGALPAPEVLIYKKYPTLENFVKCRKLGLYVEPSHTGGFNAIGTAADFLAQYGISTHDFTGILDFDEEKISKVCLLILENICLSKSLIKKGETHLSRRGKIIPDEIIDWLTCCMLDSFRSNDIHELPIDLYALIKARFIPGRSNIEEKISISDLKRKAAKIGGSLLASGNSASLRAVAKEMNVQPSTVKRWFPSNEEFVSEVEKWARLHNPDGTLKSLFPLSEDVLREF